MKRILRYFKPYKLRVALCLLIKITGIVMELFIPILLAHIIDDVVPNSSIKVIVLYGLLMVVASFLGFMGNCKANQIAAGIARNISINLRHDLFTKIMSLSSSQIDEVTIPSLVTRMSSDTYNVHQMLATILRLGVRAPVLLIGGTIATLILDYAVALVIIATLPIVFLILYLISKIGLPLFSKVQKSIDNMVLSIRESMTGIRVIKALSKEDFEKKRFDKINKDVINYELKSSNAMAVINPLVNFILNIGLIFVIVVAAIRVNDGAILLGKVLSFTSFFSMILTAVIALNRMITIIAKAQASSIRIDYVFNINKDLEKSSHQQKYGAYIEFEHVDFSYNQSKNILKDISFKLNKGETLGIIGSTGSGKSTIINLLLRLYDVTNGSIYIEGKDIRDYDEDILKNKFGTALQYDTLFSGDIYENIDFYRNLDKKSIEKAIEIAQASFVYKLEKGLKSDVSARGTNFSGGQKQRLIIARALAANPEILILDDSSSALDYKTDALLRNAIRENYQDTTTIVVSARISSIMNANKIIVLDNGEIIGYGTHDELLKENEMYQEIYQSQLGGGIYE